LLYKIFLNILNVLISGALEQFTAASQPSFLQSLCAKLSQDFAVNFSDGQSILLELHFRTVQLCRKKILVENVINIGYGSEASPSGFS